MRHEGIFVLPMTGNLFPVPKKYSFILRKKCIVTQGALFIPVSGNKQDLGLRCSAWKKLWSRLCFGKGSDFNLWGNQLFHIITCYV